MKLRRNKMKHTYLMALGFVVILASCKKTLDINNDPNSFTDVPVNTILPAAEVNLAYALGGDASRISGNIVQYYGGHRNQPLDYGQYNITPATTDNFWTNMYSVVLTNLKSVAEKSRVEGDSIYVGVSQILTAYTFGTLTDLYGDIPFTEALQTTTDVTPAYDKQENIYPAIIGLIEKGIANIKSGTGTGPADDDVIYAGDITNWEKFANSLKLRYLNHLSKRQPTAASDFLAQNPVLITDNSENAGVVFGEDAANANPIYQFDILSGRKDNAVCNTLVDKMIALTDPRVPVYFYPVKNDNNGFAGQYRGNDPGGDDDDSGESLFSREGDAYASSTSPVMLMTAAEVQFIIAEIQFRNSNAAAAQTAYETAIANDFDALGLSADYAAYIANAGVAFNNTLDRIMEQKWITMFQAPFESWVDWRRTGVPTLIIPVVNRTGGVVPRKLPYPQLELNLNAQSIEAGPGLPDSFNELKKHVWWDE